MSLSSEEVSKKCRTSCQPDDGEDIISSLPESVICHILSRLSSKDVVRTSVLSKDWERKWTTTYNIDINDVARYSKERRKKPIFYKFMDKILLLSHDLKSFRLSCCRKYTNAYLMKWISAAFRRSIENFNLRLHEQQSFVFPISLLNDSISLRKLELTCTLKLPCDNYFPNLTEVYFYRVEIINEQSSSTQLILTFPVLKTFVLIDCKWLNVKFVEIYSPALCTFKCDRPRKCNMHSKVAEVSNYLVKIHGARLEKFESSGYLPENIILHESTVRHAVLDSSIYKKYHVDLDIQTRTLMKGFSNLIALEICSSLCEVIAQSKQGIPLPQFDRLQRLEIGLSENAKLLLELLHTAPSLKFLQLNWGEKEFDCAEVDSVPCCVTSHLEEVVFQGTDDKPLNHLAKYFLKNGLELKKVYIKDHFVHRYSRTVMKATIKRLQKFPKASASAMIFPPQSLYSSFRRF